MNILAELLTQPRNNITETILSYTNEHWLPITLVLVAAYLGRKFAMVFVQRTVRGLVKPSKFQSRRDEKLREDTLISIIGTILQTSIWAVAALLILGQLGVNIAPLLAGAGVVGLAIGFGAQSLVKDYVAGIFILAENQYRVGDVVKLNGSTKVSGTVERMTLRETVLRDLDGMVHHVPNGQIGVATNMTMEFAKVNLDVGVSYDCDLEKVEKVVNEVGQELAKDIDWKDMLIDAPKMLRVNDFGDSAIEIKITAKTEPQKQWAVTGELRKRLKIAFDKNGIEIPYPQRVIHTATKHSVKN